MFSRIRKANLMAEAALGAITAPTFNRDADDPRPGPLRRRPHKDTPFRHYIKPDHAIRKLNGRWRRTHMFLHATKGWRNFSGGIPAPLGLAARRPGKIDRYRAAVNSGVTR